MKIKNKKVLITGGCGFIGSHLCEFFIKKEWDVISYDNMTKHELTRTGYSTDKARNYNWNLLKTFGVKMVKADIRDFKTLLAYSRGCDYICHTAAQPAVTISIEDPVLDFTSNLLGTFNVLEVARKLKIPIASCATVHVYGNTINNTLREGKTRYLRTPAEIDETHPTVEGWLTPLHASKRSADLYVETYIKTYKMEAASFRLTGLYGPRQFGGEDHGWVANFAIRAIMDWPITIFGTGKQVRDILYATDVAKAFYSFYKCRRAGIYNVGGTSKTSISLIECIKLIEKILNKKLKVIFKPERYGDLRYFISNSDKAKQNLKWESEVKPEEGVSNLINWIKNNTEFFKIKK